MLAIDTGVPRLTTLTYVFERDRAIFRGVVDATNLEIFRDFLGLLPVDRDIVVSIAELDLRVPEASSLLVDRARSLPPGCRLILTVEGPAPRPQAG
jgi:hypothetical protein